MIVANLLTDYELGMLSAIFLVASPWLFGFYERFTCHISSSDWYSWFWHSLLKRSRMMPTVTDVQR